METKEDYGMLDGGLARFSSLLGSGEYNQGGSLVSADFAVGCAMKDRPK